jgi:hypothetical protein
MNTRGWTARVRRAAFAGSLAPSCQHDLGQQKPSRTIMEVVSVFSPWAQGLSWHVDWYGISPSDLAAVGSLVTAHESVVRRALPAQPAPIASTVVMSGVPGNGYGRRWGFFLVPGGAKVGLCGSSISGVRDNTPCACACHPPRCSGMRCIFLTVPHAACALSLHEGHGEPCWYTCKRATCLFCTAAHALRPSCVAVVQRMTSSEGVRGRLTSHVHPISASRLQEDARKTCYTHSGHLTWAHVPRRPARCPISPWCKREKWDLPQAMRTTQGLHCMGSDGVPRRGKAGGVPVSRGS